MADRLSGRHLRLGRAFAGVAAVLWLGSLMLPALGARGGPTFAGYEILQQGFAAWRYGVLAWFANPLLLLAVIALWRGAAGPALAAALLALTLGLSSFWSDVIAALFGRDVPELSFRSGFYLWMAAHLAAVIGGIFERAGRPASG